MIASVFENEGQRKALNKQMDALQNLERIDVEQYKDLALKGDTQAWRNRLATLRQVDPELARVRDAAIKTNAVQMAKIANETGRSDEIAKQVFGLAQQFAAGAPAEMALGEAFLEKAKERLGRGAKLPPTYQAELIKSGLEKTGGAGVGVSRQGPVAGVLGKLLGSAAVQQEITNENQAGQLATVGQAIAGNRMNILAGLMPQFQNFEQAKLNLAGHALSVVNSETPSKVGLAGQDILQMTEARRQEGNAIAQAIAGLKGQQSLRQNNFVGGLIRQGTDLTGAMMGSMGGQGGILSSLGIGGKGAGAAAGAGEYQTTNVGGQQFSTPIMRPGQFTRSVF